MKKFYLGMDIGTNSIGMACTDENYNLLRAKGKDLIATRLFDDAQSAVDRRTKRAARRRLMRRKQRIGWLQAVFASHMHDNTFFIRLNNSAFMLEDKEEGAKAEYTLFNDNDFNEKDFYKQFPTIFHLRNHLLQTNKKQDIRLYYLALHHIIKYRGHFLFEGQELNEIHDFKELAKRVSNSYSLSFDGDFEISDINGFKNLAMDKTKGLATKKKEVLDLLNIPKTEKQKRAIAEIMLGAKVNVNDLFSDASLEKESIQFKGMTSEDFDAKCQQYSDYSDFLQNIKAVYDYFTFENILGGKEYISQSMVAIYDQHKQDLKLLKKFILDNISHDVYLQVFKDKNQKSNYANYVGYTKQGKDKKKLEKCKSAEVFLDWLKKLLKKYEATIADKETYDNILKKIESGEFLQKILHADNGLFPYQINKAELDVILQKLANDYPAFGEAGQDGLSCVEKIQKIMTYKIPYYVGPLNVAHKEKTKDGNGGNAWVVRNKQGKVTPWNFDEMINKEQSNEKFMRRMTNKCTYLHNCDVLPKFSVIYQKFNVLNQLNKLKINEEPITVQLKQDIFNDLFLKHKKVSAKNIKTYLVNKGVVAANEKDSLSLSGIDGEIKASMSAYVTLKEILGDVVDQMSDMCEDIILWHTLNTDKNLVEKLILKNYGHISQIKQKIKELKGINLFKEFGRLSKEFLCELSGGVNEVTGEVYTITGRLYDTNQNLNEILFNHKYSFESEIMQANSNQADKIDYEDLADLYLSPQVKRGVWQALQMADEYERAVGKAPDKIFIEVTRHDGKKERTQSRKQQLQNLYRDCRDIDNMVNELNHKTDSELRQERLHLYFRQLGKCMYCGKSIDLESLNTNMYDVDHIVPQSMVKDDGIDNKVLVCRECNAKKRDTYPLPVGFTKAPQGFDSMQSFWKLLKDKDLISAKKYNLLTRTNPLTAKDFEEFINRQLVVTNQTVKAVAELLKIKYQNSGTKIVYSKAGNVDDFKQRFDFVKCRETNDLHHARDAYLNIVVGNVYDTKFSNVLAQFYKKGDSQHRYNLKYLYQNDIEGAWNKDKTLTVVKNNFAKAKNIAVTRYSYIGKGKFYDETVYGKTNGGGATVPLKDKAPFNEKDKKGEYKYGGYKSLKTAYFSIVLSKDKKNNVIKTIEPVPVLIDYKTKGDQVTLLSYFESKGLKDPQIIVPKLKTKSLVSINGFKCWIAGMQNSGKVILLHNAVQWFTDSNTDKYINALTKYAELNKEGKLATQEQQSEYKFKTNRFGKDTLVINKQENLNLYDQITNQMGSKFYQGINAIVSTKEKLVAHRQDFANLDLADQVVVVLNCVQYLKCNAISSVDLSKLGESANTGKTLIGNNISSVDFKIIHTSPCGLVVKERQV